MTPKSRLVLTFYAVVEHSHGRGSSSRAEALATSHVIPRFALQQPRYEALALKNEVMCVGIAGWSTNIPWSI